MAAGAELQKWGKFLGLARCQQRCSRVRVDGSQMPFRGGFVVSVPKSPATSTSTPPGPAFTLLILSNTLTKTLLFGLMIILSNAYRSPCLVREKLSCAFLVTKPLL